MVPTLVENSKFFCVLVVFMEGLSTMCSYGLYWELDTLLPLLYTLDYTVICFIFVQKFS